MPRRPPRVVVTLAFTPRLGFTPRKWRRALWETAMQHAATGTAVAMRVRLECDPVEPPEPICLAPAGSKYGADT